jgi:Domain of unknown function (DUF6265)
MNGGVIGACAVALTLSAALPLSAGQSAKGTGLDGAAWLAGDWVLVQGTRCTEEHWTSPSSNMMVGAGRTVVGGRTTSFEFMRIEARADGVYFVAQPGGRPPVDFKLAGEPGSELIFLNPGHADHLTRVVYRRGDGDAMNARVEGADDAKTFAVDYPYHRALARSGACAAEK